jgi:hypothetical protein
MNTNTTYQAVVKSTIEAVRADTTTAGKWQNAGHDVAGFYDSAEALEAVKAQFIADAILPALDKKHSAALAIDLPRKGSKEFNELTDANKAKWDAANQAKKDARAIAHTYFARVVSYAWPKEKAPNTPKTLETRLLEALADCAGKIEKAENPSFDPVAALKGIREAMAVITK